MTNIPRFPPKPSRPAPRTILFVIYPGFQILDAAGPIAAFEIAARYTGGGYRLRVAACEGGLIASTSGVAFPSEALNRIALSRIDTMIIVGGAGVREAAIDARLIKATQRAARVCRRTASICSGAFVLAAAGLLDGRSATTHWESAKLLQRLFPQTKVKPDRIYVKDGAVWTSAGISAGIDLALAMIAEDHGAERARAVARQMVVYAQRPGGQTQHSALLDLPPANERFAALFAWIRAHLAEDLTVERLAGQAGMSARNFARAFVAETGVTPAKSVERLRVEAARALLASGDAGVAEIAHQTGFNDPERMRRAFVRLYGAPPAALRRIERAT